MQTAFVMDSAIVTHTNRLFTVLRTGNHFCYCYREQMFGPLSIRSSHLWHQQRRTTTVTKHRKKIYRQQVFHQETVQTFSLQRPELNYTKNCNYELFIPDRTVEHYQCELQLQMIYTWSNCWALPMRKMINRTCFFSSSLGGTMPENQIHSLKAERNRLGGKCSSYNAPAWTTNFVKVIRFSDQFDLNT